MFYPCLRSKWRLRASLYKGSEIVQQVGCPSDKPTFNSSQQEAQKISYTFSLCFSARVENLPDPYNDLSHEMKRFVDGIADMGFSRARVARAAQKLGKDDKKVCEI